MVFGFFSFSAKRKIFLTKQVSLFGLATSRFGVSGQKLLLSIAESRFWILETEADYLLATNIFFNLDKCCCWALRQLTFGSSAFRFSKKYF